MFLLDVTTKSHAVVVFVTQICMLFWVDELKVTASTTTRSTTRRSGDLMGDQMAPGDQIFDMTKM